MPASEISTKRSKCKHGVKSSRRCWECKPKGTPALCKHGLPVKGRACQSCAKRGKKPALCAHGIAKSGPCRQCIIEVRDGKFTEANQSSWAECSMCGLRASDLAWHLTKVHGVSAKEYGLTNALRSSDYSANQSKRMAGTANPWAAHGGTLSPFSKNGKNYDPSCITKACSTRETNGNGTTSLEYWTKKAGGSSAAGAEMLRRRQATYSLERCVERFGPELGKQKWADRQQKWLKSYKKQNFSMISQELFRSIMESYTSEAVYFATHDRQDMIGYKNKEKRLRLLCGMNVMPDFVDMTTKKIIEFEGSYWHSPARTNKAKVEARETSLITDGYLVFRVIENDYKRAKKETVAACLSFLTSPSENS